MSKKLQLALLALLGFSTACSTVKNGSKTKEAPVPEQEQTTRPIRVLYGVRIPPQEEERIRQQTLENKKEALQEQRQTEQNEAPETLK